MAPKDRKVSKRNAVQVRTPRTRSKIKTVEDPEKAEASLKSTLQEMQLYASETKGDGNCMFRALSDQYLGHPNEHMKIRQGMQSLRLGTAA